LSILLFGNLAFRLYVEKLINWVRERIERLNEDMAKRNNFFMNMDLKVA